VPPLQVGAGSAVTVPPSDGVRVSAKHWLKLAVTDLAASMVTLVGLVLPEAAPPQLTKP
jgi:hypothetical protein